MGGKKVDPADLVGAQEIADRLGMARANIVYDWQRRHEDFPRPVVFVGARQKLWLWPDVEAWAKRTGRL